jgi:hypothetical protein
LTNHGVVSKGPESTQTGIETPAGVYGVIGIWVDSEAVTSVTPDPLALNSSAIYVMEDAMELLLIILVLFLLFGGGGYYGYRRWR